MIRVYLLQDLMMPGQFEGFGHRKIFIQEQVEGNPFFLEEVINALIESGTLARSNGGWEATRPISATATTAANR